MATDEGFRITVGELRQRLRGYSYDTEITFGCTEQPKHLIFNDVKRKGNNLVFIDVIEASREDLAKLLRAQNKT